jgi:hypothetical protein
VPTEIKLVENDTVTVSDDYRSVYEKLMSSHWQEPTEFLQSGGGQEAERVTVNPTYIVYFRGT